MDIFKKQESNVRSYSNSFPVTFSKSKGCWLETKQGDRYLDFLAGAGSLNYGHNNPILKQALLEYIEMDGITHGLDMHSEAKAEFLEALSRFILEPRALDYKVQFTGPTGTNAVEAAIKLAKKVKGRSSIVAFTNGFHGCTAGALAATGNQHHRQGAGSDLNNVTRLPFEGYADIDGLKLFETMLTDNSAGMDKPAAVLLETVQGEGGLNVASNEWLQRLSKICKAHDILLIVDDIQAGCGRTGTFFSFEPSGIKPDIVTLSKSISGYGLPMAIVLLKPELDKWEPGEHNGTFRGNNHAFITAAKALEIYWANDDFETHVQHCSGLVDEVIQRNIKRYPELFVQRKGRGMMIGIECKDGNTADDIAKTCFNNGMVIETAGPNDEILKFFCPLTISESELIQGLTIFENSVEVIATKYFKKAS
ncbi:MAG: diaminobutyrate--2-oxoglutarate transaminase [Vibrio toranzoniae]|jgi:diaminobutyrate-2-oxoglutarate transaminase|uniref:Diaminobutyrate--2-oxoglutarate transaminase n=1 Tax=Vibrio toranzoniae TaxID=1194427 RepID=A0A125P4Z7_9VIBR|nr:MULTISPECIES: diaminobutyrate--2-oxoglutarate transaminase [Vibrio]KWT99675.1 diaminobutyrate--2-oxoglutarate transaminase [Vibrio toranzoniae]NAZ52430.1 diaminobutyrate--2-oxoglutarate transaminase [Vibrio toranzoniae]NAZ71124.1 diaminobutyrate--2-oxoglutarate transaminase [Vibrio toranzoniae]NAZ91081.1 diaminobutyrate--2-oxoglutarate transaminase [Vibrio toranzoniae]NAZ95014.1 diaminobutyrate--2-oxoglutarate transaminase [Vibrio toranzoniae]